MCSQYLTFYEMLYIFFDTYSLHSYGCNANLMNTCMFCITLYVHKTVIIQSQQISRAFTNPLPLAIYLHGDNIYKSKLGLWMREKKNQPLFIQGIWMMEQCLQGWEGVRVENLHCIILNLNLIKLHLIFHLCMHV